MGPVSKRRIAISSRTVGTPGEGIGEDHSLGSAFCDLQDDPGIASRKSATVDHCTIYLAVACHPTSVNHSPLEATIQPFMGPWVRKPGC
jgi:hypothetical protein